MLPSLLARDIEIGLKQFLVAGYEPADPFLHGLMSRFTEDTASWLKGPWIQLGLPFATGTAGRKFFAGFETDYPGYRHQEQAWQRLASNRDTASTLVATGTGSGKTECFLYPVLDHCARARASGVAGIKALVIYPMNALATDQARRIAGLVATVPAFAGLRVGLYVGGAGRPGEGLVMTPTGVITDRETLRRHPPDILLTNYKMLDYLMLRPRDRALWSRNASETLHYVVVDELHTFDGAQGTDLALLLRRLAARLKIPPGHLICAGTSATLGASTDTAPLRDYARQVFGVDFPPGSVVTESRISVESFLGDATVDHMFVWHAGLDTVLDPAAYTSPEAAVRAWFGVLFGSLPQPADDAEVASGGWRRALGEALKRHQLFVNLLRLTKGGVASYAALTQAFARNLPAAGPAQVARVLDALLVLVAFARGDGGRPLVTLRVQLWVRELRRMVAKLARAPQDVRLVPERDLPGHRDGIYLPLIQCTQCHTTGWLSRLVPGSMRLSTDLNEIYNTWFSRSPEATRLYAAGSVTRPQVAGRSGLACTACGNLQPDGATCRACGQHGLMPVFRVEARRSTTSGNAQFTRHDDTCPSCGERHELLLMGARNATLGSQIVDASWASVFNDDKKLIAFSDSVQDAAHRAGFFGARTWLNNVRTAWAQVLDQVLARPATPRMAWPDFLAAADRGFDTPGSVLHMSPETLVAELLAPDLAWQRDWATELLQQGRLPAGSRLPERVRKRLLWQLFADLTYQSRRGRTLERIGKVTLAVPWKRVEEVAATLMPRLREQLGITGLDAATLAQWLWGMLAHMRRRGGVMHPEMADYVADADVFRFVRGRREWLPVMGPDRAPRPVFVTLGQHRGFDRLTGSGSWYERWLAAALGREVVEITSMAADVHREATSALEDARILVRTTSQRGDTLAIAPDALVVTTDVAFLTTAGNTRRLAVPATDAEHLKGMPCLDAFQSTYDAVNPQAAGWWADRFSRGNLRRVIAAEHTGLLERPEREALEQRFKDPDPRPWYENLLSATPTLEMGVDIGDLSAVLLCSVPPNQASFLQRIGRAGRRDGNAVATTLADGNSPHDLYFFAETEEMLAGEVTPPGVFLKAAEVLRRQLFAFCMDDWVSGLANLAALPENTSQALDAVEHKRLDRFPFIFTDHVLQNEQRLFDAFMQQLGADADDTVRARLLDYMQGQGDSDGLRSRLVKTLEELVEERKVYKARKDELDKTRKKLEARPQDEATKAEIDDLDRERDKMLELIAEINGRDLLNTLTDAGLIPNYAFPEAGIQLKSVLWRRRGSDEPGPGNYITLKTQKYERPAQSALSEFAPENRFYANQRRVEIDQINMNLAKVEDWRFCPSCHHMQNLAVEPDAYATCQRCGDPMWADGGQRRALLRFRQAIANSDDTRVRIDDSSEDREPKYYVRQLMADFATDSVREAWRIPTGSTPFGFEFIPRVVFRDVNFGELAKPGDTFQVAGKPSQRPGFRLCRHCGKVQTPQSRNGGNGQTPAQEHSFDCPMRGSDDPTSLLDCLYLYREFESEALRILVPYTRHGMDETVVQSFMAALQLGLKRRFGGKVDHLRLELQDMPGKDGEPRRHFVLLYDTVPGGTGYLHQLLAHDAGTLREVLRMALGALTKCTCNDDPEKDGCYSCLYQYRLRRSMDLVSRDSAKAVLSELVDVLDTLERVDTIADIYVNPNFDSVLEQRFIESLRTLGGADGLPPVKLVQDVVNGRSGYVLDVGGQRYRIEPQVELMDGLAAPSRPDFVIRPWAASSRRRPVAVFCDGWTFHKDTLRADAVKRSALLDSRRYHVWSVTHQDVSAALDGKPDSDLESPMAAMARHDGARAPDGVARAREKAFIHHAVARLLQFLARDDGAGDNDASAEAMQRDAAWLGFLTIPSTPGDKTTCDAQRAPLLPRLPLAIREPGPGFAPMMSRPNGPVTLVGWWPMALANGLPSVPWTAPAAVLLDEAAADSEEDLHRAWRRWLHVANTLQFLPGVVLATATGLDAGDYDGLTFASGPPGPEPSPDHAWLGAVWEAALQQALAPLRDGLEALARGGASPPEVGMELADDRGRVLAEAELAWPESKLAILRPDQADMNDTWAAAKWTVIGLDEVLTNSASEPWHKVVAVALGLDPTNME
jgi:DEAD/DEAH box helicase domain-containing protein